MTKKIQFITTITLIISLTLIFIVSVNHQSQQSVPEISFHTLDGKEISLSDFKGQPVLILFWATTCHLCLHEMPELIALYDQMRDSRLEIIGIAMPYDPPNRVVQTTDIMKINFPIAVDIYGEIVKAFGGVSVTPTSFLISPDGLIVKHYTGLLDIESLREQILEFSSITSVPSSPDTISS